MNATPKKKGTPSVPKYHQVYTFTTDSFVATKVSLLGSIYKFKSNITTFLPYNFHIVRLIVGQRLQDLNLEMHVCFMFWDGSKKLQKFRSTCICASHLVYQLQNLLTASCLSRSLDKCLLKACQQTRKKRKACQQTRLGD
jgi:hypothetical protein